MIGEYDYNPFGKELAGLEEADLVVLLERRVTEGWYEWPVTVSPLNPCSREAPSLEPS